MAEANIFHYHAFLSYSHDDGRWGDWLHGKLEEFELDEAPLGRPTLHGRVLKPIFQDRKGFRADPSLGKQTREVLEKSAAMVVICSPSAAKSLHVAREICEFRRLPQGKRVFAFIVGGEPHDAQNECFPRPLIWTKDSDGELSVKEEPIAADAREIGDGADVAVAKLISGLLDLPLEAVWKRELAEKRRSQRRLRMIAVAFALLALGAGGAAYLAHTQQQKSERLTIALLDRAEKLMDETARATQQYGMPARGTEDYFKHVGGIFDEVEKISGQRPEIKLRRAKLGLAFSRIQSQFGDAKAQVEQARRSFDSLQSLAREIEEEDVVDYLSRQWTRVVGSLGLGSMPIWLKTRQNLKIEVRSSLPNALKQAHYALGEALRSDGNRADAAKLFEAGLEIQEEGIERKHDSAVAETLAINARLLLSISNIYYSSGNFVEAQKRSEAAIDLLANLKADIRSREGYEILAESYISAADIHRVLTVRLHRRAAEAAHFSYAIELAKSGLDLARELHGKELRNISRSRLLAKAYLVYGDIRRFQKEMKAAAEALESGAELLTYIHKGEPDNNQTKLELGLTYVKLAETERDLPTRSDWERSYEKYLRAIRIFEELSYIVKSTQKYAFEALRGAQVPLEKLNRMPELLNLMLRKQEMADRGTSLEDRARANNDLGNFYRKNNQFADARRHLKETLVISKDAPQTAMFLIAHRAQALLELGAIETSDGRLLEAGEVLAQARTLAGQLAKKEPNNIDHFRFSAEVLWQISIAQEKSGKVDDAVRTCEEALQQLRQAIRFRYAPAEWRRRVSEIEEGCRTLMASRGN